MLRTAHRFSLALLAAILCATALAPQETRQDDPGKLDQAWWARAEPHLRRIMNLPRATRLTFKRVGPAGAPEFRMVTLEIRQGEKVRPFLLLATADGTKIIADQVYDLTRDPFARNRERMGLERVPSQGPAAAPVTVVEYSDYTCPWCAQFFLTVEKPLLERYAGRVRYIYKQFPLVKMRARSQDVAVAAACAFRQSNEAFWAFHGKLFTHRARFGEPGIFSELARGLPLDGEKFRACIERRESLPDVERDIAEGERLGVDGTPNFFINGRPLRGFVPLERFLEIVEEELAVVAASSAKS